jgi:putative hemolysin
MVPRVQVQAVSDDVTMAELRKTVRESAHTRLPVYHGSLDQVVGLIHSKDVLLRTGGPGPEPVMTDLLRPVPMVPGGTRAVLLLERMRAERAALALILDEHGGTAGIVTLEDLVEELFGEVEDEFDGTGPVIGRLPDGRLRLRGEDPVARVNADLGLRIRPAEARTVGGYMMEALERVARPGDQVTVAGYRLTVERVSGKRVETVLGVPVENGDGEDRS